MLKKLALFILAFQLAALGLQAQNNNGRPVNGNQNRSNPQHRATPETNFPAAAQPPLLRDQIDDTDIYAIPLDDSEVEDEEEMQAIYEEQARKEGRAREQQNQNNGQQNRQSNQPNGNGQHNRR
jgi:hypothetical protein